MTRQALRLPHHTFAETEQRGPCRLIGPDLAVMDDAFDPNLTKQAVERFHGSNVSAVILIHGTFAGNDIAGLVREVSRFSPVSARRLRDLSKRWFDDLVGEVGNFTEIYADRFAELINTGPRTVPVHCYPWSGENHHIGRADGVMGLLETIDALVDTRGNQGRVLVLAHSHGGNVLAMLSQIAGLNPDQLETFFSQTRPHYHSPIRKKNDLHVWRRVRDRLRATRALPPIDVATFGTPLRYRWNRSVCPKLLHFIQHRVVATEAPTKAVLPTSIQDGYEATAGDYVQHFGIGGTDFLPSIFAWRDWVVEKRMRRMFESTARRRDVWPKLKQGRRESCDGTTLLVDYSTNDNPWDRKLLGHGVYTCHQWLPFHLSEIARHFYTATADEKNSPS